MAFGIFFMHILICNAQVPFVRGGAEMLAENLLREVRAAGHEAEIISVPFKWYPPRRILDTIRLMAFHVRRT